MCFSYSCSLHVLTMPGNIPISPLRSEDDVNLYGFVPLTINFHFKRLEHESVAASSPHFPFTGKSAEGTCAGVSFLWSNGVLVPDHILPYVWSTCLVLYRSDNSVSHWLWRAQDEWAGRQLLGRNPSWGWLNPTQYESQNMIHSVSPFSRHCLKWLRLNFFSHIHGILMPRLKEFSQVRSFL